MKGVGRDSAEAVVVGLIGQATLVVSGVLLARQLGPEQRGYVALLLLWPILVSQIGELGVPKAVGFFIARDPRSFDHIVGLIRLVAKWQIPLLVVCNAIVITVFLLGRPAALIPASVMTIVSVPAIMAADYGLTMLQGQQRFRTLNLLRLVNPAVVVPGLLILAAAQRTSLLSAVAVLLLALCASGAAFLFAALKFRPSASNDADLVSTKDLIRFGMRGLLGSIYPVETFRIDQIAVGLFLSPTTLGLYVVGVAFSNLPGFVAQSLGYVAYPRAAAVTESAARRRLIWRFFWIFVAISLAIVLPLELTVGVLIPWFFGPQFLASIGIARIALVGGLFLSARRILAETLRGAGYPLAGTLAEATLLAVLLPTLIVGGHYWSAEGVAGSVALASLVSIVVLITFERYALRRSEESVRSGA